MFKPLLAAEYHNFNPPYLASPKIDAIRCLIRNCQAVSRSLKPLPNKYVQDALGLIQLNDLDGELAVGSFTDPHCFSNTTKFVMSKDREAAFTFWVFDDASFPNRPFQERYMHATEKVHAVVSPCPIDILKQTRIDTLTELHAFEDNAISFGFEGVMLRSPDGHYKYGRSTVKENILLKVKRFDDAYANVVGFAELMHNENPSYVNELGDSSRASLNAYKEPMNTLGALIVKNTVTDVIFKIGTGFTQDERLSIWNNKKEYLNRRLRYKFFPHGMKDKPRHPVFLCWMED